MSSLYNSAVASHYEAYRPDLHQRILSIALEGQQFTNALDIGCGTGISSEALLPFCSKVVGIDPSEEMVAKAEPNDRINYRVGELADQNFAPDQFDLIAFAGSLFYCKTQLLANEVERVLGDQSRVIIYDFNVSLEPASSLLDLPPVEGHYDHSTNLSGLELSSLELKKSVQDTIEIMVSVQELAHLILSDYYQYEHCVNRYKTDDPFDLIVSDLKPYASNDQVDLVADIFYSTYTSEKT